MKIEILNPSTMSNYIEPALVFPILLTYNDYEFPLFINGWLMSSDNKLITPLFEMPYLQANPTNLGLGNLAASGTGQDNTRAIEKTHNFSLIATLNPKAVDYIEGTREKNDKKDMVFNLVLGGRYVTSNAVISSLHYKLLERINPGLHDISSMLGDYVPVTYKYENSYTPEATNLWVLSGNNSPIFLTLQMIYEQHNILIHGSDWTHDYAPALGLGKFVIAELPVPNQINIDHQFAEQLNGAFNALSKMSNEFGQGEWTNTIKESRPIAELLRREDLIKSIMCEHGNSEAAANEAINMIKSLFEYSSKLIHRVDRDGKTISPESKAEKEDAYLVYSFSVSFVNLLTRKAMKKA